MADAITITQDEMRKLFEEFFGGSGGSNLFGGGTSSSGSSTAALGDKRVTNLINQIVKADKQFEALKNQTKKLTDAEKQAAVELAKQQKLNIEQLKLARKNNQISNEQYRRELGKVIQSAEDLATTLGDLDNEAVKDFKRAAEKAESDRKLKEMFTGVAGSSMLVKGSFAALGKLGGAIGKTVGQIQDGASGAAIASGALVSGIELVNSGAQTAAGAMTAVGGVIKGPWAAALTVGGEALSAFSNAVSDAAKFAIKTLTTEVEKQISSYHIMTSAGAMFTDGMTGMMKTSGDAGISIKTMSDIVKNNSESMYRSGMSIAEATKKVGKTYREGGDQFKNSLINLGYSIEEQGGLITETMQYMKIAGRNVEAMTGGEIAAATQSYATNLKMIAGITGEDAKKKVDQAREASANAAVQAKLAQMDEKTREQFILDLAVVPDALKAAVMQQKVLGAVVDKNANIMMATVPGLAGNIKGFADGLGQGVDGMGKHKEALAKNIEMANKEGSSTAAMGIASIAGLSGSAVEASNALTQLTLSLQKGALKEGDTSKLRKEVEGTKNTTDATANEFAKLQIQGAELTATLEKGVNVHLKEYGRLLAATNEQMIKGLGKAGSAINDLVSDGPNWGGAAKGAMSLGTTGALIGSMVAPGPGTAIGGGIGVAAGGIAGALGVGFADGGIASGSPAGFMEKLHGTELVVPMTSSGGIKPGTEGFSALVKALESIKGNTSSSTNIESTTNVESRTTTIAAAVIENNNVLLTEVKKMTDLLIKQNTLAEEAATTRRELVDISDTHRRTSERILNESM